jgi:predicted ATPase
MPRPRARPTNLLDVATPLFGRDADVSGIGAALGRGARLITLTGPGGMGKTRLALRLCQGQLGTYARRDGGGVWFCELTETRGAVGIRAVVASELGLPHHEQAEDDSGARGLERGLARRGRVLLVLDNFEHLVAEGAPLVQRWLRVAPLACFIVTSRVALGIAEEQVWPLAPLAPNDAAALFTERAKRVRPDLPSGAAEEEAVAEIVEELQGLPLAIELAASRMAVLSHRQLRDRLRRPLELLASPDPGRHGSMRRTVMDSAALLTPREHTCFATCAIFRGGFDLAAAEAVVAGDGVLSALDALTRSSLVRVLPVAELGGEPRLALFEAIREVAAELLAPLSERAHIGTRHATYYAALAARLGPAASAGQDDARHRLALDLPNLRAAYAHAIEDARHDPSGEGAARALAIAVGLDPLLSVRGLTSLRLQLLGGAIEVARASNAGIAPASLAAAVQARGLAERELGDTQASRASLEEALALAEVAGGLELAAMVHTQLGELSDVAGATTVAHERFARALSLLLRAPASQMRDQAEAETYLRSAHAHRREGNLASAEVAIVESITRYRQREHDEGLAGALYEAAVIAMFQGRGEAAMARFDEGLAVARGAGARATVGALTTARGGLLQERGALAEARMHHAEAARIFRELGSRYRETSALYYLATAYLEGGDARESGRLLALALARVRGVDSPRYEALIEGCRALALAALGDGAAAKLALDRALGSCARCGPEPALEATIAIHRMTLAVRATGPSGGEVPGPVVVEARALVQACPSDDSRFALRALLALGHLPSISRDDLCIGEAGASFTLPGRHDPVDLSRRAPLRRVLMLLARHRRDAPGEPVSLQAIIRAGWPSERIDARAADNRAYVALATLRKLGLRALLQTSSAGYCLHPGVGLRLSEEAEDLRKA